MSNEGKTNEIYNLTNNELEFAPNCNYSMNSFDETSTIIENKVISLKVLIPKINRILI